MRVTVETMCTSSLLHHLHACEAALVAHHKQFFRAVGGEMFHVEGFVFHEAVAEERLAGFEFGVFGFADHKPVLPLVFEQAAAVGIPCDFQPAADGQIIDIQRCAYHAVRRLHTIHLAVVAHEGLPVGVADEAGEDVEGALAGGGIAVHIAPKPFEGGGGDGFAEAFLYHPGEKGKIGGGFDAMVGRLFYAVAQKGDVLADFRHDSIF